MYSQYPQDFPEDQTIQDFAQNLGNFFITLLESMVANNDRTSLYECLVAINDFTRRRDEDLTLLSGSFVPGSVRRN